jgi:hypothetical protein
MPIGFSMTTMSVSKRISAMMNWQPAVAKIFFTNQEVKNLLTDPNETFDLVIIEYFLNDYLLG